MDISYGQLYIMNREEARKQIVSSYLATGSISRAAYLWQTYRNVVRKWVRRFEDNGEEGLKDRSRRPRSSPRQTPEGIEQKVLEARRKTGYGKKRLSWYLARKEGIVLSPHTLRHILSVTDLKAGRGQGRYSILPIGPGRQRSPSL